MKAKARTPTNYPPEFHRHIQQKNQNFIGRDSIFTAIQEYLNRADRGYITIVGAAGAGKSAILAKYATENPQVAYYTCELPGYNEAEKFITTIGEELLSIDREINPKENQQLAPASQDLSLFSILLQKISNRLPSNEKQIIIIDAIDRVDTNSQAAGTNVLYLPRYLPEKVYILLTRRPYLREKADLLIETPSVVLNLENYRQETQQDIQTYIQQYLSQTSSLINNQKFLEQLTAKAENNFMYLTEMLATLGKTSNFETTQLNTLPATLQAYYQQHWQQMTGRGLSSLARSVASILSQNNQGITAESIAESLNEDEYDVEKILEKWREFLHCDEIEGKIYCRLYHSSFGEYVAGVI
ncbi:MAG: ATP-binding protein [Microcoleus vaginatus WJT46-NPBG5]|jgi:GTPase SAR1 family protein|nr:ATP-binding protein [Microcoleus vaginatus WJT46-NPBG5]